VLTTKVRITFLSVSVNDSADIWGDGEWVFKATVDGKPVGDPKKKFVAREKGIILLPEKEWSTVVDVSAKTNPADRIMVTFSGTDIDIVKDDDLGQVSKVFKYPFDKDQGVSLVSPVMKGWLFLPDHQYYSLKIVFEVLELKATTGAFSPTSVGVSRQHDSSQTFSTIGGKKFVPRVEVCPVIPPPQAPSKLPKRPDISTANGLTPGKATSQSLPTVLWPLPSLNAGYNPSLIPILLKTDPDLPNKAAKLAITYIEPGDLDTSALFWVVKSGPAEIVGSPSGPEVLVIGTGAGAVDVLAEFEVRWEKPTGPLLATHRAWVGKIKTISYRINLINGSNAASRVVFTPQDYENQMKIARIIYWQAGIDLAPDANVTCRDGARTVDSAGNPLPKGMFIVPVTNNTLTVNVNNFVPTIASRLNFRVGAIHAVYVRSTKTGRAAATDIQGVDGSSYTLGGVPSASWIIPSGVPPEAAPVGNLTLLTFPNSSRLTKKAPGDDNYVIARKKVEPAFVKADMGRIYAAVLPSGWSWNGTGTDPNAGVNLAHELGHVLGLRHRGSGDANNPPLSEDAINCLDASTPPVQRGHPWNENVMSYGYGGVLASAPRALDIDLLQAPVIRKHPACT